VRSTFARYAINAVLKNRVWWWKLVVPHALLLSYLGIGHEPKVWAALRRVKGNVFVDVGAGYGWYVSLLRQNFKRLVAIDADPEVVAWLRLHVPANCKVLNFAISERNGKVTLERDPVDFTRSIAIIEKPSTNGLTVSSRTLSSLFPSERVDLVKVDVEGAEWLVLKGAHDIMDRIGAWLIELHDPTRKTELASYMKQNYKYNCTWVDDFHAYLWRQ